MHERDAHDFLFYLFCRQDDEPRPNTLTKAQKKSARSIFDVAVTALTHRLKKKMAEVAEARGPKARLGGTEWDDLCSSVAIDFEVHKKHLLQKRKTCYSRISRDNLSGAKTSSPLAAIEPIIVDVLKKKARMRQPVTMKEALAFANSLISGSAALEDLKDYHVTCGRSVDEVGELGTVWWSNFLKRHPDLQVSKPVPFPNRRATWSTYENFKLMYEETYSIWERCGIAERLESPSYIDREGNFVSDDVAKQKNMFKSTYQLLHPEGALNADEISHNTNTTKDKLQGFEKRVHVNGERAQKIASESDVAWTMLAVTALTGDPVCCVVIIEGKRLAPEDLTGDYIMVSPNSEDMTWLNKDNHGAGKRYPGGPSCSFRGCTIPAFVTFSDSGGITSQILTDVLKHIDNCEVFKRQTDSFTPTIQLDGHHSRFGLEFLEYCRQPRTKWDVSIGCPESTHLWQIQDSSEMNGLNKRWAYHYKDQLLAFKRRLNLPITIKRPDIIPIVNRAWKRSFSVVKSNQSAIEERGWNPPNMALLHHPAIIPTKPQPPLLNTTASNPVILLDEEETISVSNARNQSMETRTTGTSISVMEDLNYDTGNAGEMITDVIMWAKDNDSLKRNVKIRTEDRKSFHTKAKEIKRLSPGFFFTNRKLSLTSDDVYNAVKERSDARLHKEKETVRKAMKDRMKSEETMKQILLDANRFIQNKPNDFPEGAPQDTLHSQKISH